MAKSGVRRDEEERLIHRNLLAAYRKDTGETAVVPATIGRYVRHSWLQRNPAVGYLLLAAVAAMYGYAFGLFGQRMLLQFLVPLVALGGVVLWIVPEVHNPPVRLLTRLFTCFVFALLCWPDYLALTLPGLPWITAIRLFGFPLVAVLLYCIIAAPKFRAQLFDILSAAPLIWKLVVAFAVLTLLSIGLSDDKGGSISRFIVAQYAWIGVFFSSVYYFSREGSVPRFSRMLWGIAVFCIVIGLYEVRRELLPWAGRIPFFLQVEDERIALLLGGIRRAASGIYRVQSKFSTSIGLGEYLGMALPFILHLLMTTKRLTERVLLVLTLPVLWYIVLKTDSRLAFITLLSSLFAYTAFFTYRRWRSRPDSLFAPAIIFSFPVAMVGFILLSTFWRRLEVMIWGGGAQAASSESRREMYQMGMPMVYHNPLGHGIGQAATTLGYYSPGSDILTIDTYYLSVLLEFGFIGFAIYYGMFVWGIWRAGWTSIRTKDSEVLFLGPACIALVNFVISKSVYSQQENHPLAFMLLGLVVALLWRQKQIDLREQPRLALPRPAQPVLRF